MNENKLIEEFWRDSEDANFSKEATVLFFYLLHLCRQKREAEIKMHPARLLSKIKGFDQRNVVQASEELQSRGYIDFTPATETCSSGIYRFRKGNTGKKVKKTDERTSAPEK